MIGRINVNEGKFPIKRLNRICSMLFSYMRNLPDEDRDIPVKWHIMHMYSSSQIAKLLALKRRLDPELSSIAAALHDIGLLMTGKREGHAEAAKEYVLEFIEKYNVNCKDNIAQITGEEALMIINAIIQHSQKDKITDEPFVELLKDVDCIDRYLHGVKTEGHYLERCKRVLEELDMEA